MELRNELRRILYIIANLSDNNTTKDIKDKNIINHSDRPQHDVYNHLMELESLGLITRVMPKDPDVDFTIWNITLEGLEQLVDYQKN